MTDQPDHSQRDARIAVQLATNDMIQLVKDAAANALALIAASPDGIVRVERRFCGAVCRIEVTAAPMNPNQTKMSI